MIKVQTNQSFEALDVDIHPPNVIIVNVNLHNDSVVETDVKQPLIKSC